MEHAPPQTAVLATVTPQTGNDPNFPEHILRLFFKLCIWGPVVVPPPRSDPRRVLTQVCAKWRAIVVSTPTFWNSFNFARMEGHHPWNLFRLTDVFFLRSGQTVPLAIELGWSLQNDLGRAIFELIIRPRAHRVWLLSCNVAREEVKGIFGHGSIDFSLLKVIDIGIFCDSYGSVAAVKDSIVLSGFQHTPSLQYAKLRIPDGVHPTDLHLPWHRLTRIDLGQTSTQVGTFVKILAQSLLLEDGVFLVNFTRSYNAVPTTVRRIVMPLLRRLRLRMLQPSQDERIFEKLRMPILEELWLEREELRQPIRDMATYALLLAGSNTTLHHLTIGEYFTPMSCWFTPRLNCRPRPTYQDLTSMFRLAHNLTSLYLCPGVYIHPLVLEKIASGEFLPLLEMLGVSSISGWDIIGMINQKNIASSLPLCSTSSNSVSPLAPTRSPVALRYLCFWAIGYGLGEDDIQKLEDAIRALRLLDGYLIRYIDNPGQPLFKTQSEYV